MITAFAFQMSSDETRKEYHNKLDEFSELSIWGKLWFKLIIMNSTCCFIIIPLNLLKNISKLRFTSILGIICLLFIAGVIICQLPFYIQNYSSDVNINWADASTGFTEDLYFFKGIATLFYAYSCHYGAFPVYEKLYDNNPRRTNKVLLRSIILDASFYLIVGVTGYLTQPIKTPDLIIKRDQFGDTDYVMTSCRLLMCLLLFAKIPANYNSMRLSIFNLIWKDTEISTVRYENLLKIIYD